MFSSSRECRIPPIMATDKIFLPSRRQFLQTTGGLAAASVLPSFAFPSVHVQGSDVVQVALVGCGGRGGGAAANALMTKSGPVKLVAMADVFEDRLRNCHDRLKENRPTHAVEDCPYSVGGRCTPGPS